MTRDNRRSSNAITRTFGGMLLGAISVAAGCADESPPIASAPGMTYESIEQLPDFSGWWQLRLDPAGGLTNFLKSIEPFTANLKPEAAEQFNKVRVAIFGGGDTAALPSSLPDVVDLGQKPTYCQPPRFAGNNGGFVDAVEFLFTPGRVTITNESGLIRRIFLDRPVPADADETYVGTSVGHWEGQTLVVETVGLYHGTEAQGLLGALKLGNGARTVEKFSLKDPDTIEVELTLTAPDIYTAPIKAVTVFERLPDYAFQENTFCTDDDRSVDPDTGRQRFDLTPPADIAPPPR